MFDLVDWEACLRHTFDFARFEAMLARGDARARFYEAISRKARAFNRARGRPGIVAADALAMAVALDPDIVTRAETRHVAIEMTGALTRGATVVDWEDRLGGRAERAHRPRASTRRDSRRSSPRRWARGPVEAPRGPRLAGLREAAAAGYHAALFPPVGGVYA